MAGGGLSGGAAHPPGAHIVTADRWGIDRGYRDTLGRWRETPEATLRALLTAMGAGPTADEPKRVQVLHAGQTMPLPAPTELILEDGTAIRAETALPPDLPVGYHELRRADGRHPVRLIVSPGRCHLPRRLQIWGWTVQLYSLRSTMSWGIGDLADLRRLARWSAEKLGAGVVLVNPMHAVTPIIPQQPSPYYPGSRRYRSPLYLRIEEAPGAEAMASELEPLAAAGRALNAQPRLDRDAVFRLKMGALGRLWSRFGGALAFDRYRAEQGQALAEFATFCALSEHHGSGWRAWPAEHRRPASSAVAAFGRARAERVRFHQWLQWLLDEQLARAAAEIRIIQDLPVGFDPDGEDAWTWQDLLATGISVGAPPDEFNPRGQDWGVPPFVPHRLRAAAYEPFAQTLRATLRHAGGLRIDHVMGLFRLFWIPEGGNPEQGAYVRYPAEDLLAIVAVESHRARAVVVGEDLGTVEEGVREQLAARRILSCRLLWFEAERPASYPRLSLAAVTTHDLPTISGLWSGADLRAQRALGLSPNQDGIRAIRRRLRSMTGLSRDADPATMITRAHRLLAEAPSVMIAATLEDALALEERPNIPGTTGAQRANWSIALPALLEAIEANPLAASIGRILDRRRRIVHRPRGSREG